MTYDQIFPPIQRLVKVDNVVIPDMLNVSPLLAVLLFTLMTLLLFYLIDRAGMQRKNKLGE